MNPDSAASTGAMIFFLISGCCRAVFPVGFIRFRSRRGISERGLAEPRAGRAGSPRVAPHCLLCGSQNAGARRPQASAPAKAFAAGEKRLEIPTAAPQCSREGTRGCLGCVWVLSPLGRCASGAHTATPGLACAVCTQKVKYKTIIGRFNSPQRNTRLSGRFNGL